MATQYPDFGTDFVIGKVPGRISGIQNLIKKIQQRLITPNGTLYWDPAYGLDVRQYLNSAFTNAKLEEIQSAVKRQCELDERVLLAEVSVEALNTLNMKITIQITTSPGPSFLLILSVTQLTIELLTASITQ
jgi:phage baseplate assembly protein W